jgi:molybdopterin converting factor small subunit
MKIYLELLSWLSETLDTGEIENSVRFEMDVEDGCAVKDLFSQIAARYPRFEQSVFDSKLQKLNETVSVLHNNRPIELENGLKTRLNNRDTITLVPIIQGG